MMRILKWLGLAIVVIAFGGFLAFLYYIPPFFSISSEDYVKQAAAPAVSLDGITDPAQRAIAERGKYIFTQHFSGMNRPDTGPTLAHQ